MPAPIVPAPTTPRTRHRPRNSGLRFSTNAFMPSTRSSVAIASSYRRRSCSRPGGQGRLVGGEHRLLARAATASGGRSRHHAGQLQRRVEPAVARRQTSLTMPELVRLGGADAAPGEHQLHRALLAHHAREPLRAAAAGDDPEQDLRLAELGRSRTRRSCRRPAPARSRRRARSRTRPRPAACGSRRAAARSAPAGEVSTSCEACASPSP